MKEIIIDLCCFGILALAYFFPQFSWFINFLFCFLSIFVFLCCLIVICNHEALLKLKRKKKNIFMKIYNWISSLIMISCLIYLDFRFASIVYFIDLFLAIVISNLKVKEN